MATQADLDFTYSLTDRIFRLSLGELADFSGVKYDGDFSLTLEQAQRRNTRTSPSRSGSDRAGGCSTSVVAGDRCSTSSGSGAGRASASRCPPRSSPRAGVMGSKSRSRTPEGSAPSASAASMPWPASAPSSTSAPPRITRPGARTRSYLDLFARIAGLLPEGGRLYLQTMVFGRKMVPLEEVDIDAPRDSDGWYLALMQQQFPGSFLPFGQEQVVRNAEPHFRLVASESGRLDYIETIRQWRLRFAAPSFRKRLLKLQLVPRWLTSTDFRLAFASGVSANSVCFERELLDHYRLVFEKL